MKKVVLIGHSGAQYKEGIAGGTITPGNLVERDATTGEIQRQASARSAVAVAIENHWVGGGLNDNYVKDDRVAYQVLQSGAEFQALVQNGAAAIVAGDLVKCNTSAPGTVTKVAQTNSTLASFDRDLAIGIALEAKDNSGGSVPVRIRIEVL